MRNYFHYFFAAFLAVASITLVGTGLAYAAPQETGPTSTACVEATATVSVKTALVVEAAKALDASDATINEALLKNVEEAGKALAAAVAAEPKDDAAIVKAQKALQKATELLDNAASDPALSKKLVDAQAVLNAAVKVQLEKCAEPKETPAPTTTTTAPPVTTEPAPTKTVEPQPQIIVVPNGGVATGDGSLA